LTKPRSKGYCDYRDHFFPWLCICK
jgi:hypothetical protein